MRRTLSLFFLCAVLCCAALCVACAAPEGGEHQNEQVFHPEATPIAPFEECTVITYEVPASSAGHRDPCSALSYPELPPAGGDHYGQWAAFGVYEAPVPWGFLVHAMEHGAVVLSHDCEGGCPEVEAELEALTLERIDPLCRGAAEENRLIVAPQELDYPVAAVAWERVYLATCLDLPSLEAFIEENYGQAPENFCAAGVDLSATGWCP